MLEYGAALAVLVGVSSKMLIQDSGILIILKSAFKNGILDADCLDNRQIACKIAIPSCSISDPASQSLRQLINIAHASEVRLA